MVGVPHRLLTPSLPTGGAPGCARRQDRHPDRGRSWQVKPQKALRGGIPGDGFGIWGRFWSHFAPKVDKPVKN